MGKIILDESELKLVLEKYRDNITDKRNWLDNIGTAGSLFLTIISSDFKDLWIIKSEFIQYTVWLITAFFLIKGIITFVKNQKNTFNKDILFEKISEKSEVELVPFSIIIIKDTFNHHSNKYLVYDDGRWNCKLFLNYYMQSADGEAEKNNQLDFVSSQLKIDKQWLNIRFLFVKNSTKYSPTANKNKSYDFYYYYVTIDQNAFSTRMRQTEFEIDGKRFRWMSMDELMNDKATIKRNNDVLRVIKNDVGAI